LFDHFFCISVFRLPVVRWSYLISYRLPKKFYVNTLDSACDQIRLEIQSRKFLTKSNFKEIKSYPAAFL
jgi:hypothetical protein